MERNVTVEISKVLLSFSWIDYTLFVLMFGLSTIIGIYYGCFGNKQSTTKDYLHGGKTMKTFPVAMSLMASNLSGISLLGIPAETYMFGSEYVMCIFALILAVIIIDYTYLPVFYKLQLNSTYEYLKIRFSNRTRTLASLLFVIMNFLYIPIVIYVPALAFNQGKVTGIDLYIITPVISFICIFYTTLGGLKAVVWTDTLQFTVTLLTLAFVLIMGTISVGGFVAVWERSNLGERLEFFNMDPDPTLRATFWTVVVGCIPIYLMSLGTNPATIQRFMAVPTLQNARRSLILLAIGMISTKLVLCFLGLIMYTKYHDCDPLTMGNIKRSDQILAYYVLDVVNQIPGISGLFIAGVFSTALSTLSTYLNSLSGIIYMDFIAPFMPADTSEIRSSNIMKFIVVTMGFACVCLVFVVEKLGAVLEMNITFTGVTAGSLLGLFTLGMMFPNSNEKGAFWGGILSLLILGCITVKTQLHNYRGNIKHLHKPLNINGCAVEFNSTATSWFSTEVPILDEHNEEDEPLWLFRISFYYYSLIGATLTIVIGLFISWFTSSSTDPKVDSDLICPFVQHYLEKDIKTIKYTSVDKNLHIISEDAKRIKAFDSSFGEKDALCL